MRSFANRSPFRTLTIDNILKYSIKKEYYFTHTGLLGH